MYDYMILYAACIYMYIHVCVYTYICIYIGMYTHEFYILCIIYTHTLAHQLRSVFLLAVSSTL